jgi:hypothetical protein
MPTEDEIEQAETEPCFEHCADTIAEEISSEAEEILLLILYTIPFIRKLFE